MVAIELDNPFGNDPNDFGNKYVRLDAKDRHSKGLLKLMISFLFFLQCLGNDSV